MSTPVFHAPAVAVPGLRTVLIGRTRQVLGTQLNQLAAATLVVVGIGGVAFESLRLVEQDGVLGTQWQTLGALYVVLAFVIFFLQPTRPGPRRVNGSAARALVSTGPYRRWLVREAHIPALFTAGGYAFRVLALVVVWLGGGFIYVNLLRGWLEGAGTVLPAAWVVLGALGVGVLSTLLLIPGRHQARTRIDEEGQFVPLPEASTAGERAPQSSPVPVLQAASVAAGSSPQRVPDQPGAQDHAAPARVDQPREAVPVGPPTPATPTPPPTPGQPTFGGRERGRGAGRTVLAVLLAVLLTIAVGVAIVGYLAVGRGEARSPNELGDQLAGVDVTCLEYDKIFDERQSKALGCRSDDSQLITITTYGSRPATDEWLEDLCASNEGQSDALRQGVYIVGEDWIINMHQLEVPKGVKVTPIAQTSEAIAAELGGVATPYDCTK